jgi:hypothetical protein|eukprot:COSAG02_NODE_241_length_27638_cov_13.101020_8_plen_85_part_00
MVWLVLGRLPGHIQQLTAGESGRPVLPVLSAYYSEEDFRAGGSPALAVPLCSACHVELVEGSEEAGERTCVPHFAQGYGECHRH